VISNGRIASYIGNWVWRPYKGPNAHRHHVHVSVSDQKRYYDSTAPWGVDQEDDMTPAERKAERQAIIDGVADELMRRMAASRNVPNQPLQPGGPVGANFTVPGAISNIELNQDQENERTANDRKLDAVTRKQVAEIHAAVVKPAPKT
jgi:hypothetical protein